MQVIQVRVDDHIDFYSKTDSGEMFLVATLFDGHEEFIVDEMGTIATLKIVGELPTDFKVTMPLTPTDARLIDMMPTLAFAA